LLVSLAIDGVGFLFRFVSYHINTIGEWTVSLQAPSAGIPGVRFTNFPKMKIVEAID
jgi:hypothetical protein